MSDDNGVAEAVAAMARAQQAANDRMRAVFRHAMRTVAPDPDKLRQVMLMNMTTSPKFRPLLLGLTWMQSDPNEWKGWHPEVCEETARQFGVGEEM